MIDIEQTLLDAFPELDGRPGGRALVRSAARLAREGRINRFIQDNRHLSGLMFLERILDHFHFTYRASARSVKRIPAEGRVIIVANHPIGSLDGLALLKLVRSVRPDVSIVANQLLWSVAPLRPLMLPVDNMTGQPTRRAQYRRMLDALEQDQAVIVFPAGEVSRILPNGVRDGRWKTGFLRLAAKTGAPVLPVYVGARNSALFYGLSALYKPLGTMMLAREMFNKTGQEILFRVGRAVSARSLEAPPERQEAVAQRMRRHVYLLRKGREKALFDTHETVAHPVDRRALKKALYASELLGETQDGKKIFLCDFEADSAVMREVGRLRELTFRRVDEGVGAALDVNAFDAYYKHLVLWDEADLEIVGAYRIGNGREIMERHGLPGFYSQTLFAIGPELEALLPRAIELGRSFVQPRYWGQRSLDYLWYGIGAYLRRNPDVRYMFGPVSLSGAMPHRAQELIVAFYQRHFAGDPSLARARRPFAVSDVSSALAREAFAGDYPQSMRRLRSELEQMGCAVPTLYKQYAELCDDGGCRFIDYNVDPAFGACIDALIWVDVDRITARKRNRYIGAELATAV